MPRHLLVNRQELETLFLGLNQEQFVEWVFVLKEVSSSRAACRTVIGRNDTFCPSSTAIGSKGLFRRPVRWRALCFSRISQIETVLT